MDINEYGRNLNILCLCDLRVSHGWGAFSFWYSVTKKLPEAQFVIGCKRSSGHPKAFQWTYKVGVPLLYYKEHNFKDDFLILSPYTVAARTYDQDSLGPVESSKSNDLTTFIAYSDGVGSFVIDDRIDTIEPPFGAAAMSFSTLEMTVNELCILKNWELIGDKFLGLY